MLVTLDVVSFRNPWHAFRAWRAARRPWLRGERETVPGRSVLGAMYTFWGRDVHPPRGPKPRVFTNSLRRDAWGIFPDLRRIFVLSLWESEEALARFEATRPYARADERWSARLRPVKVKGSIHGEQRLPEMLETRGTDHLPGIVVTWNKMYMHRLPPFRLRLRRAADQAHASPGALASFLTGHVLSPPHFYAFTISCWRRLADAAAFAYRGEPHVGIMRWYGSPHRFGEGWWARFVIERSEGTLAGRDPFAGAELEPSRSEPVATA